MLQCLAFSLMSLLGAGLAEQLLSNNQERERMREREWKEVGVSIRGCGFTPATVAVAQRVGVCVQI